MTDVNLINGIALAFEGDAVYSMYIRRHLIFQGLTKPNQLHREATKYVSAKAQANLISLMLEEGILTERKRISTSAAVMPIATPRLRIRISSPTVCLPALRQSWATCI